MGGMT